MRRIFIIGTILATIACGPPNSPQLAPQQAQAQRTVDALANSRSVVRWLDGIAQLLEEFDHIELALYSQGLIDGPTHGRLDIAIDLALSAGSDVLSEIEAEARTTATTGTYNLNIAKLSATLLSRLQLLDDTIGELSDPRLANVLNLALSTAQLVLQTLDPNGLVRPPLHPTPVIRSGVPSINIPLTPLNLNIPTPPPRNIH